MHDIRLAGPWELLAQESEQPTRIKLPARLDNGRQVTLRRGFHRPGGLVETSKLAILVDASDVSLACRLNGHLIVGEASADGKLVLPLDDLPLPEFNTLELQVKPEIDAQGVVSAVFLRIIEAED